MNTIRIRRQEVIFQPDSARVIIRPFIPSSARRMATILKRALDMSDADVDDALASLHAEFASRHFDIDALLMDHFEKVRVHLPQRPLPRARQLLIGAMFSGEYALESAALFNPSIVPHPDQAGVPDGALRFIMSLRATGEGHISSIEFRTGVIQRDGSLTVEPVSRYVTVPEIVPNPVYRKVRFVHKLQEMGFGNAHASCVMDALGERFTLQELDASVQRVRSHTKKPVPRDLRRALECIHWLAESNYELRFPEKLAISERIIFPVSPNESNGIEDARFVRFTDADGSVIYCATYTAYNGRVILPQFIETEDFLHFRVLTLNGNAVQNKGMALFPRRINGRYAMLSRQDDENLFIMFSDHPHHWSDPQLLMRPAEMWESVKIGNCGSPVETEAGWLVITHGVGPMRKYCIGAALLDLNDPTKVIGRLKQPLLSPEGNEREGYVPNVVYSCGSLLHGRELILPYAMSDKASAIATVPLDDLLAALTAGG